MLYLQLFSGMICLSLPIGATPRRIASLISEACTAQKALSGAWALQARCGALTRSVPSPLARLTLNLLSRRYAVSYAEINAPPDAGPRTTVWGQTVDHVIYWRPPQANISKYYSMWDLLVKSHYKSKQTDHIQVSLYLYF